MAHRLQVLRGHLEASKTKDIKTNSVSASNCSNQVSRVAKWFINDKCCLSFVLAVQYGLRFVPRLPPYLLTIVSLGTSSAFICTFFAPETYHVPGKVSNHNSCSGHIPGSASQSGASGTQLLHCMGRGQLVANSLRVYCAQVVQVNHQRII